MIGAAAWYDERDHMIGSAFVAEVSRAIDQLAQGPERRSVIDFGVRSWPVSRFPFVVFYDLPLPVSSESGQNTKRSPFG